MEKLYLIKDGDKIKVTKFNETIKNFSETNIIAELIETWIEESGKPRIRFTQIETQRGSK